MVFMILMDEHRLYMNRICNNVARFTIIVQSMKKKNIQFHYVLPFKKEKKTVTINIGISVYVLNEVLFFFAYESGSSKFVFIYDYDTGNLKLPLEKMFSFTGIIQNITHLPYPNLWKKKNVKNVCLQHSHVFNMFASNRNRSFYFILLK